MPINVYYAKLNNMGDLLNELIIPYVTGHDIVHCPNYMKYDIMGIGSFAGAIFSNVKSSPKERAKDMIKKVTCSFIDKPCAVWGTGFFENHNDKNLQLLRKNVSFIALRGELSKNIVEKSLKKKINPVLCDGGILSSEIIKNSGKKRYRVGFIPHYREHDLCKKNGIWDTYEQKKNNIIINLKDEPIKVIEQISECELIVSSSLHGCIVADSFHIPNVRVRISDIPGSGFKFDDYYSGFGIKVPALNMSSVNEIPTDDQIIDNYKLDFEMIDKKKRSF